MAHSFRKQPTSTHRRKLLAAALVICCALSLAFISTATAKRERPKTTPTQPAPAEPGASATGQQTGAAPASSAESAESGATAAGGQTSAPSSSSAPSGKASAPSGTVSPRHDHHGGGPSSGGSSSHGSSSHSSPSGSSTGSSSSGTPVPSASASAGRQPAGSSAGTSTEGAAETQAKRKKEAKSKHPKEPVEKGKGKSLKGSGSGEGESGTGSGAGTGAGTEEATGTSPPSTLITPTLTATPAAEPSAAAANTATTPPAAVSTGSTTARANAGSRSVRAPRHAKASRRPSAAAPRAGDAAFTAAAVAPLSASAAAAARRSVARRAHNGAGPSTDAVKPHGRPSPLVNTITKIVNVVPVAVRMLIAALLGLALLLAMRSRVAALRARRLERQRVQLTEDVGLLQAALLPVPPQRLGPVGTSAAYQPAAGPGAGGDFYDVFALADGQLAVIVGDVSGHGREALPHTALVRFTLRAYLEAGMSPRDALQTAGAVLERQLGGVFATVVVATYQPRERTLVYASAGHPPPVVLGWGAASSSGAGDTGVAGAATVHATTPVTVSASPPVGVGMRTGTRQTVVSVPGRAQICFYTDGLTEARVGSELFGSERLIETLAELGPAANASALLERVAELADARPDDMAACLLSVEGDERAPVVLVDELEVDRDEAVSGRTERFLLACGVERQEVAEMMRAASVAAGPGGTVVLEARHSDGPTEVTLQREQIAYLHARRANMEVAL